VRVIAATTHPLEDDVREGRFREDLLRRLQVARIGVPPLRERRGDVPLLAQYFLARGGAPSATLSAAAIASLQAFGWPGNVRQLENVMHELAAGLTTGEAVTIEAEQLPPLLGGAGAQVSPHPPMRFPEEDRRTLLLRALSSHGGNRTAAARALGIGRATFYRWWREAGLGAGEVPSA
jgi:DNA-binding NtrC family response regulator